LGLGGRHAVGAAQVGDQRGPPLGQRAPDRGLLVDRARSQGRDRAPQHGQAMMLPAPRTASGAIDGQGPTTPGVGVADRSRGGLGFAPSEQFQRDLTTAGARRFADLPPLAAIVVRDPPDRVATAR
jgi:hypothetical protein